MPRPVQLTATRQAVLEALVPHQRPVDPDEIDLAKAVGGRVTATLHEMRKIGLLTFTESTHATSKNGHHQGIKHLEITDKGRSVLQLASTARQLVSSASAHTHTAIERRATPADGQNLLQSFLARPLTDGVLTRGNVAATAPASGLLLPDERPARKPRLLPPDEAAEAMGTYPELAAMEDRAREPEPEPLIEEETRPEFPTPILDALRAKQAKVQAASALLEEAGLDDEAIRILDALHLSPSEDEYLAFAKSFGR